MRILFDQGTPFPLRRSLSGLDIATAYELGWSKVTNGRSNIRLVTPLLLMVLVSSMPAAASITIPSRCSSLGSVSLEIGTKQVGAIPGSPSAVNYESRLWIKKPHRVVSGTTAVFWGGIAKWFTSSDGRYRYQADLGVSGGKQLKMIRFQTPLGSISCTLLES